MFVGWDNNIFFIVVFYDDFKFRFNVYFNVMIIDGSIM